jgi:hypothetical protein
MKKQGSNKMEAIVSGIWVFLGFVISFSAFGLWYHMIYLEGVEISPYISKEEHKKRLARIQRRKRIRRKIKSVWPKTKEFASSLLIRICTYILNLFK